jgi:hypothetical protein
MIRPNLAKYYMKDLATHEIFADLLKDKLSDEEEFLTSIKTEIGRVAIQIERTVYYPITIVL